MGKNKHLPLHKIIVVGAGGVGKSALTLQFMYGDFVESYDPTSADSYRKPITINDTPMHLDILDTAGQEEYAAMRDNYYRTGEGFLCVYSITREDTLNILKSFHDQILRVTEKDNIPFVVVGNKADLEEKREVQREKGKELADSFNAQFLETSAKTNVNVQEAFMGLAQQIIDIKLAEAGDKGKKCLLM